MDISHKKRRVTESINKRPAKNDVAASYNSVKEFDGKTYTGMVIRRSHKWYCDKGVWHVTRLSPTCGASHMPLPTGEPDMRPRHLEHL